MSSPSKKIRSGRNRALAELEKSFDGPVRGLQIAPEFFNLLQSPELAGTPLAGAFNTQNAIFDNVLGGLSGNRSAGQLPSDLANAIGENLASAQGARGTFGSPAGLLEAANRFSGASESIAQSRISQALQAVQAIGAGSIFPSASQFLQVGANKAANAAQIQFQAGQAQAAERARQNAAISQVVGTVLGGFFGPGGAALGSQLGSAAAGGGPSGQLFSPQLATTNFGNLNQASAAFGPIPSGFGIQGLLAAGGAQPVAPQVPSINLGGGAQQQNTFGNLFRFLGNIPSVFTN